MHAAIGATPLADERVAETAAVCPARRLRRGYALVMTPEVRAWLHYLRRRDRTSAILVARPSACCSRQGPSWASRWREIRIAYIFDHRRNAVLLVARGFVARG